MADFVREQGIAYPVAIDRGAATTRAYAVDSYPDYYLIDRAGNLRFADLANAELERAIEHLLAEPAPVAIHPALAEAHATATRKDQRILAVTGEVAAHLRYEEIARADREVRTLLTNEFAIAQVVAAEHPDLLASWELEADAPHLVALTAAGERLGATPIAGLDTAKLRAFASEHRIPAKDAEALWKGALERATRENKRVLVHLGAPW